MKFKNLIIVLLVLGLSSCGSMVLNQALKNYTVEKKAIPENFGKGNTVLLCVIHGKNKYDKYMKENVKKEYHGEYEFVLKKDIDTDKYSDTDKYRYVFDEGTSSYKINPTSNTYANNSVSTMKFSIYDRKEDKLYSSGFSSSYFSTSIKAYMINLEQQRIKNK